MSNNLATYLSDKTNLLNNKMDVSKYQKNTQKIFLCVSIYFDNYKNTTQTKKFLSVIRHPPYYTYRNNHTF